MTRGNKKKGTMLFGKQEERNKMTTRRKAHASNHEHILAFKPPIPSTPLNTNPKKNKNPLTHSNPQLLISSSYKGSEEHEDNGTRRPGTQDDQGEQGERNHIIWQTRRKNKKKEQDDNNKKGTCFKPSSPQLFKPPIPNTPLNTPKPPAPTSSKNKKRTR